MIQVYTGNGKGKTTAALGLAIRAAGAGLKVYIAQFCKGKRCSEHISIAKIENITIACFGRTCFIKSRPGAKDIELAQLGLETVIKILKAGKYRVIILDEINIALKLKLLRSEQVLELLRNSPKKIELVLTGRFAHPQIVKLADLVSEIKEVKHYFKQGIKSRKGIEY